MLIALKSHLDLNDNEEEQRPSPPPAKKQKKNPKILDGTFYTIQSDIGGDIKAMCTECLVIKSGTCSTTGNFRSHYRRVHPEKFQELDQYTKIQPQSRQPKPDLTEIMKSVTPNVCSLQMRVTRNLIFLIS